MKVFDFQMLSFLSLSFRFSQQDIQREKNEVERQKTEVNLIALLPPDLSVVSVNRTKIVFHFSSKRKLQIINFEQQNCKLNWKKLWYVSNQPKRRHVCKTLHFTKPLGTHICQVNYCSKYGIGAAVLKVF